MKKILVAKDLAYANDKSSSGANSATNPAVLLDGAVGIYGIPKTSVNNKDKLALILDAGSDAAGKVPDASFDGDRILIAVGTADGAREAIPIDIGQNEDITIVAQSYAAAVAGVYGVGYVSTTTSANLPTALNNDVIGVKVFANDELPDPRGKLWTVQLTAGETGYSAFKRLANKITNDQDNDVVTVKVSQNVAGAAAANAATLAAVKGATTLTSSAAHGIGVGDYVSIDEDVYQAVTGTATTSLVLDTPYRGATATVANAAFLDLGATAPTNYGLRLTAVTAGVSLVVGLVGNLEDASNTVITQPFEGTGTYALLKEIEDKWSGWLGTASRGDATVPQPSSMLSSSGTYDVYTITYKNRLVPKGEMAKVTDVHNVLVIAFPAGGSGGGQAEFEDIMGILINGADGIGGID